MVERETNMPKQAKALGALDIKRLPPGKHFVGGVSGLMLAKEENAASWVLRVMVAGKRRHIGLGSLEYVSLAQAREKAREAKLAISEGIDPVMLKKAAKRAGEAQKTLAQCVVEYHKRQAPSFRSAKHAEDWIGSLKLHVLPTIGDHYIQEVDRAAILRVIEPLWFTKTETASRMRQRLEKVFDYAKTMGYFTGDNPAAWRGNLEAVLPARSKVATVKHHPALPWQRMAEFMADLRTRDGLAAKALQFLILTGMRSQEVRLATWDQVDLTAGIWVIPAEIMKMKRAHRVPLSKQALALLKSMPKLDDCPLIFPGVANRPQSDATLAKVIKRMNEVADPAYTDAMSGRPIVPHGFRSSFRDWAAESTGFASAVAEMALAHRIENKVEAAYRRGDLLEKRKPLMQAWADHCDKQTSGDVVPMRGANNG